MLAVTTTTTFTATAAPDPTARFHGRYLLARLPPGADDEFSRTPDAAGAD
ncbi:hypothetical protein [Streptomyces pratensis]